MTRTEQRIAEVHTTNDLNELEKEIAGYQMSKKNRQRFASAIKAKRDKLQPEVSNEPAPAPELKPVAKKRTKKVAEKPVVAEEPPKPAVRTRTRPQPPVSPAS